MNSLVRVGSVALVRFRQNITSARTLLVFGMLFLYIAGCLAPLRRFALGVGYGVPPYAIVFMIDDQLCQIVLAAGALVLFSGAPFRDGLNEYILPRAGRIRLALGNSLYILAMSVIYVLAIFIFQIVAMIPALEFTSGWGKVINSVSARLVSDEFANAAQFWPSAALLRLYSPAAALALTLSLEVLCVAFLGMTVYIGNRLFSRPVGLWLGGGFVMLDITIFNVFSETMYRFSPLALPRLSSYAYKHYMPLNGSFAYGYLFLGGCTALMIIAAVITERVLIQGRGGILRGGRKP